MRPILGTWIRESNAGFCNQKETVCLRIMCRMSFFASQALQAKEEISMARKVGQIVARGDCRWLIRVLSGPQSRNLQTQISQSNHPRSDTGRAGKPEKEGARTRLASRLDGAKITLNEHLDRWRRRQMPWGLNVSALRRFRRRGFVRNLSLRG